MRWWGGSGISWTICKSFAPQSKQITAPVPHHSVFTGRMPFLLPNQQHQSTDNTKFIDINGFQHTMVLLPVCDRHFWCHCFKTCKLECGPMPNVMAALLNIGGALSPTPQFGWRPLLDCHAVMLPRRETRWNLQGCSKLRNRSQPLVEQSSPYYEDMWRLNKFFFQLSIHALVAKIQPDKDVWWCRDGNFLRHFCVLYFQRAACSTFQTCILNLH